MLEPPQAAPVVIEDDAFIGSRCMVTEGASAEQGAMLGAGVILNPSIPVIDGETGEQVGRGRRPAVAPRDQRDAAQGLAGGTFGLPCVLILKRLVVGERHDKGRINYVPRGPRRLALSGAPARYYVSAAKAASLDSVWWVVDGNNVMGAGADGWWNDPVAAATRLRRPSPSGRDPRRPGHRRVRRAARGDGGRAGRRQPDGRLRPPVRT